MNVYIGLDVSLASTAICMVSAQGKIVKETTATSEPEDLVATLKAMPGVRLLRWAWKLAPSRNGSTAS